MRLLNLLLLFVFAITAHAAPAAGEPKNVGRSEKKGRSISPMKARKLKVPLPPISDRCSALPTAGEWVVFTGSIPMRIQLGGATVLLGTQTRLPAAGRRRALALAALRGQAGVGACPVALQPRQE